VQLVHRQLRRLQCVRAERRLRHHERDDLRVQRRVVERYDEIDADRDDPAGLALEDCGAKRSTRAPQHILFRELDGDTRTVCRVLVRPRPVDHIVDPGGARNADFRHAR
jgi:hypothetical protein